VEVNEKDGDKSKKVKKAGKAHFSWFQASELKAEVGDFDALLKECEEGKKKLSWSKRVKIIECGNITKVVTKKGGKKYTFLSKLDGGKLMEATNASTTFGGMKSEVAEPGVDGTEFLSLPGETGEFVSTPAETGVDYSSIGKESSSTLSALLFFTALL